jgi:hypothetical protein
MRIRILGKVWNVRFAPAAELGRDFGTCDPPSVRRKEITVRDDLRGRELVDTIIHESLHAGGWHQLDEAFVDRLATDVSRLLWRPEVLVRVVDDDQVRRAAETDAGRASDPSVEA